MHILNAEVHPGFIFPDFDSIYSSAAPNISREKKMIQTKLPGHFMIQYGGITSD
jgi:hypothetical protein